MKIKIEHESARSIESEPHSAKPGENGSIILPYVVEPQELDRWCLAAIAVSMAGFYNTGQWRQSDVAGRLLGYDCSRCHEDSKIRAQCDQNWALDEALQVTGCFSHWSPGKPSFERIVSELESGRPIGIRIEWYKGGAHYLVIFGYHGPSREIHIADSKHGVSRHYFDRFPHDYQSGGAVWTENFWTCPGHD